MAQLVDQPTKSPTRKVTASLIAGAIAAGVIGVLNFLIPDADLGALAEPLALMLAPLVGPIVAYFVRERG